SLLSALLPPRPPLLPYTTLFRSTQPPRYEYATSVGPVNRLVGFALGVEVQTWRMRMSKRTSLTLFGSIVAGGLLVWVLSCMNLVDRKSTRLNSSHVKISYAVFCL